MRKSKVIYIQNDLQRHSNQTSKSDSIAAERRKFRASFSLYLHKKIRKETERRKLKNTYREWAAQRKPAGFNKKKNRFSENKKKENDRQEEGGREVE